jgi:hypothetical protein
MWRIIIGVISITLFSSGCHKTCLPGNYVLYGGSASINPDQDSIRVGDTLWLICSVPLVLKYISATSADSSNYDITGAQNFATDFQITSPLGVGTQAGAISLFSYIKGLGSFQNEPFDTSERKTFYFQEQNGKYVFSVGIIAKTKGIYCLSIIDILFAKKSCDNLSVSILMDNSEDHLYYLQDIYYGGGPIDYMTATHSYCFKVY